MDDIVGTFDWELRFQAINQWVTCDVLTEPEFWSIVGLEQKELCGKVTRYVEILKEDTTNLEVASFGWESVGHPEE